MGLPQPAQFSMSLDDNQTHPMISGQCYRNNPIELELGQLEKFQGIEKALSVSYAS